jgi:DNA-binding transcriptional LysR family regulator
MDVRHLRYFDAVVRAGSIARAASTLRVAQPALSRQIRDLEGEIGTPLLVRDARGTRITVAGESVHRSAREALERVAEFAARARLARRGLLGRCRLAVGSVPLLGDRVGMALAALRTRLPAVDLDVREIAAPAHAQLLRAGETDIAIGASPGPHEPGIEVSVFYRDPMDSAAIPAGHTMARRSYVTTAQLRDIPVLVLSRKALPHVMTPAIDALRERGFAAIRELDNLTTINAQVASGRGWALVPRSQRGGRRSDGYRVLPIDDLRLPFVVTLSLRARERSPMVLNVARALRTVCADARGGPPATMAAADPRGDAEVEPPGHLALEARHLRAFVTLIDERNLTTAARRLALSQPALSRRLADLERLFGVDLFERGERGITTTHVGELLESPAREALAIIEGVGERAHHARQGIRGTIRIGVVSPAMGTIMAPVMASLARECAHLEIVLHAVDTTDQCRALEHGTIDIGIAHSLRGLLDDAAVDGVQLWEDRLDMIMLAADHPLSGRACLTAADLRDEPALFPHRHWNRAFHDELMVAFEALGLTPKIAGSYFSLRTMWSLAANGVGWMIGAHSQRRAPPPRLVAVPLDGLDIPWGFDLIWRRREHDEHVLAAIRAMRSAPLPRWSAVP